MIELLTSAQMRAIEQAAILTGQVSGEELMERAGRGVVAALGDGAPGRAAVLCGPGNNGGDGFVIARLLAERGWQVTAQLLGDPEAASGDAARALARWRQAGGAVAPLDIAAMRALPAPDLWVDALFGTGLSRPLEGVAAEAVALLAARRAREGARIVAVDIASGLCSDSGRFLGPEITPDLTVSFHRAKCGHYLADGARGRLVVADIGLAHDGSAAARLTGPEDIPAKSGGHKYDHGHVLVPGGPPGYGGAARLAARGALRVGAGLVTLACPPAAVAENAARLDAVMLRPLPDAAALEAILEDVRITALCLGPGLGVGARTRTLVAAALGSGRGCVLDADALTAFIDMPETLLSATHPHCVLTPHDGEFARLFPDLAAPLREPARTGPAWSRLDAARAAARRAGCTVLLKGPDTVIADSEGNAALNAAVYASAVPWLATAGAGDVLAGLIAGLMARGCDAHRAARAGAWLHVAAARRFGAGLIAEDLPEALPAILRELDV